MRNLMFGSVTRIADFSEWPFRFEPRPRQGWESGDYVVAEVLSREHERDGFELATGRLVFPMEGDLLVGALARRAATLEATGSYEAVGDDRVMHCLTSGGCFGRVTSKSRFSKSLMPLRYLGHVLLEGRTSNMREHVPEAPPVRFDLPVFMIVGTSMSAGKTYSGRVVVRLLSELGHTVVGVKLTGAGRWHDTLSLGDAGAAHIFDFVDAGLPTTVCEPEEYRTAITGLLSRMAATNATVAVVEAGASPLEPYNGGTAVEMLREHIAFTVLCASDPYAVVGIQHAWNRSFDVVAGPTANTEAGVRLVDKLASISALDLMDKDTHEGLRDRLRRALETPTAL